MESITALTTATAAALARDYFLWLGLLVLVLAFGLYVYFVPNSFEFFDNQKKDARIRSEPPSPPDNEEESAPPAPAPESSDLDLE
jgi:hypothetical protein